MAQSLQTFITINAKVGNGFGQVGATLTELGSMINGISQELINFGKDSVKVYRDYEKSMTDAEVALSTTYGRGTKELNTVMGQLDVAATNWAATTIFHTNDVANAISEAAHAGWDFDQIMNGIPAAMQLAQAGSIDLSEAVNYIVKASNAAGIEFDDLGHFIDIWTFAANSSASTVDEFGAAMLRMGGTMRFAANPEELMTLLAVTANAGSVGSEAGTLIRNSMIRLIAPTEKAEKAMAQLGATSIETAGLMEDEALMAANARLEAQGFSAYDEKGNLKSTLDIYRELYVALGGIAGGFENIDRNQDALQILSAIFPTRTITEALNLLRGAAEGYDGLYESMMGGAASGYGEYAATTMMDTLDGQIETFESKVERLKQLVGVELKGQVEQVSGFIGDIVDGLAEMPEEQFSALVSGLEVVAAAGPALLLAGGAFRLIGYALTPAGGIGLGLVALTSAAAAIKELQEADFASNFGEMELDAQGLVTYIQTLGAGFKEAYSGVDDFKTAMNDAVEAYNTASSTFSSTLLTDMLTGVKLTDNDKATLESLGNDMYLAIQSAITNSTAASMSYWQVLFGGEGTAELDPAYQEIFNLTNEAYTNALAEAESISQGFRKALSSAFEDGTISDDEYQQILAYMRAYNDAMARAAAEAQSEEDYIKMGKWMHKAQTASLEEIKGIAKEATTERDTILADQEDRYLTERFRLEYRGADEATLAAADERYRQEQARTSAAYDDFLLTLWDSQIRQSDQAGNFERLYGLAEQYMAGVLTGDTVNEILRDEMGKSLFAGDTGFHTKDSDRYDLGRIMGLMLGSVGGQAGIADKIAYYEQTGNTEMADRMRKLYTMEQLINNFDWGNTPEKPSWDFMDLTADYVSTNTRGSDGFNMPLQYNRSAFEEAIGLDAMTYSAEAARQTVKMISGEDGAMATFFKTFGQVVNGESATGYDLLNSYDYLTRRDNRELENIYERLSQTYDFDKVMADYTGGSPLAEKGSVFSSWFPMWELMYGSASTHAEDYRIKVTPEVDPEAALNIPPVAVPIEPKVEGQDSMTALQDQGVEVQVSGDTTELEATIDGSDGKTLMEYVSGDATNLSITIKDQDGKTLIENVTGNASSLASLIASYNGRTITVNIKGNKLFAEGGRATSASIFGEAGPEWAIPEEHSQRTAELLDDARAASGFTWPEILSMFGGMNAGGGNGPATLIYSPTINAQDATGVAEALNEDKKRLEKWFEEKRMQDEAVVYS